jgi:hypothetical protein
MVQPETHLFRLGRIAYQRTRLWGWLLCGGLLLIALCASLAGFWLWPTYVHIFTPYLKWQDMLVALCWYTALLAFGGSILVGRFLYALHMGYRREMVTLIDDSAFRVRDLSHENLLSIFWLVGTVFLCCLATQIGLIPEMLLGWTLHLPHPALVVLGTGVAILLGLAGLVVSAIAGSFVVIGLVGSISFCRNLGAPHTYQLSSQTRIMIDGFVLTIIYPDKPESMLDLNLLDADDQKRLLHLLHDRWLEADRPWNPALGEEIAQALKREHLSDHAHFEMGDATGAPAPTPTH